MLNNYYKVLNIAENATQEKITTVYYVSLKRWLKLKQEKPHLVEHIDKCIAGLEKAYQTLSDPVLRAHYDKTLKNNNAVNNKKSTIVTNENISNTIPELKLEMCLNKPLPLGKQARDKQQKSSKLFIFISLYLLIACVIAGYVYYYYYYKTNDAMPPSIAIPTTQPQSIAFDKLSLDEGIKLSQQRKEQNAFNPQLKDIAFKIANAANTKIYAVINNNLQFVGAKASNQNITYRFVIFDDITKSKDLLSKFLLEKFISDSSEVCENQQNHLINGILFTLAYFNSKGELVGSYYIDQQVCFVRPQRLIKKPDINQLNSIEVENTQASNNK